MKNNKLVASMLAIAMLIPTVSIPMTSAQQTSAADLISEGTGFFEDFEDGTAAEDAVNQENGWSYDGLDDGNENHSIYSQIWVGDNGSGSSNAMRFASTTWFKTMWLNLDFKENGVAKYVAAGYDVAEAEEKVEKYLSEDMQLSLRFKLATSGTDPNQIHQEYIRLKGDRYNHITELRVINDQLYLCAMNATMTSDEQYLIGTVDISSDNNVWHDMVMVIDKDTNSYRMTIDGMTVSNTPWGADIPVGKAEDEDKNIGRVSYLELGHEWSGWWQGIIIDDLTIGPAPENTDPIPTGEIETGSYQITSFKTGNALCDNEGSVDLFEITEGASNQKWYIDYINDNTYRLINAQSGMAASVSTEDDCSVIQEPIDETSKRQLWQTMKYTLDNGDIHIINYEIPKCIQIDGGNIRNGGNVALWDYESSIHSRWTVEDAGNGFVYLKNGVGKYFQVDHNNADTSGAKINSWELLGGNSLIWTITDEGNGMYSISKPDTGERLISDNGSVCLAEENGSKSLWTAEYTSVFGKGSYYVFTNVQDNTELTLGDETQWMVTSKTESSSLPIVKDIDVSGKIDYGEEISVSYNYCSADDIEEGESQYKVYILSAEFDSASEPIVSGVTKGEFGFTVPEEYNSSSVMVIEIVPRTYDGISGGRFFKYIKAPNNDSIDMDVEITAEKKFTSADLTSIRKQQNGWIADAGTVDSDYILQISTKDGVENTLGIIPTAWWKNGKIKFDLDKAGVGAIEGNGYVEFDAMFDAPHYFDSDCRMVVALNNGTMDFASVRLMGRRMDIVAMNADATYRKLYTVDIGSDKCFRKWMNFKFYTDGTDSFAVAIDDRFVRNDEGGIWFKAAQYACDGPYEVGVASAQKIAAVKMGFEWAGMDSALRIANIKFGNYTSPQENSWSIVSADPNGGKLEFGKTNDINVKVVENESADGIVYVGLYKDGKLISVKKIEDITFNAMGVFETTVAIDVPEKDGDYELKAFAWSNEQKPISGKYIRKYYVEAAFAVANVFSDNMMLQADKPVTVWGSAFEGRDVEVMLTNNDNGTTDTAKTISNGTFSVELPAKNAGGNYTLTVTSGTETQSFTNIIFGDVFLLSGQSNMEYRICDFTDTRANIKSDTRVNNSNIRAVNMTQIATNGASQPQEKLPEVEGTMWKEMNYDNAYAISAIGYYFAQQINAETGRPVGILAMAVGGTGSDTWVENGTLYNNRVYPVRNLELSGILYYQGCADVGKTAKEYSDIMAGIVDDYRKLFGDEELPFYYAQLARFNGTNHEEIRAGQTWAFDKVSNKKNVGFISTLDEVGNKGTGSSKTGNARNDIHPNGKEEIASRFALWAKRDIYGEDVVVSGPMYKSISISDNVAELEFECTGSLKIMNKEQYGDYKTDELIAAGTLDPTKLGGFEMAGADGKYYDAQAEIVDGNKVRVTCSAVSEPVKVRYAWGAYPEIPNLTDDTNLPSYTFATDCMSR